MRERSIGPFSGRPLNDLRAVRMKKLVQPIAAECWNSVHHRPQMAPHYKRIKIRPNQKIFSFFLILPFNSWRIKGQILFLVGFDIGDWALTATRLSRSTVKRSRDDARDDGSGCNCARDKRVRRCRTQNLSAQEKLGRKTKCSSFQILKTNGNSTRYAVISFIDLNTKVTRILKMEINS